MKKIALVLLVLFAATMAVSAQDATANESEYYVTTLYIEKVYATTLGYRIDYRRPSSLLLATSYFPLDWFGTPDSVGKIVYGVDNSLPYVNVYWIGNEVDYFVLYVHRNINDLSWGSLPNDEGLEQAFDVASPQFDF